MYKICNVIYPTCLEAKEWNKKYTSIIEKMLRSYFFLLKQNDFQKAILEPIVDTTLYKYDLENKRY